MKKARIAVLLVIAMLLSLPVCACAEGDNMAELSEADLQALDRLWTYTVQRYMDSATAGLTIPPRDRLFLERYYKCTMVGVTLDWLESRMSYDLMEAAVRVCDLLAGSSQRAFLKCAEEGKD